MVSVPLSVSWSSVIVAWRICFHMAGKLVLLPGSAAEAEDGASVSFHVKLLMLHQLPPNMVAAF